MKLKQLFTILCLLCTMATNAQGFEQDRIRYRISDENTVAVTKFYYKGDITIPESVNHRGHDFKVTSIEDQAFSQCIWLTSITIPNSVTNIGNGAFMECSGLTSVTFGDNVTSIGDGAFYGCKELTSITMPDCLTDIGQIAFAGCIGLTSINLPNSVTNIGIGAFLACSGLTSITIPNSITCIADGVFCGCTGLKSITIPESVKSIGSEAFSECTELRNITIGNSVTHIGAEAFYGCEQLKEIILADGLTSIGNNAFNNCTALESIIIPSSVTNVESFGCCNNLKLLVNLSNVKILSEGIPSDAKIIEIPNGYIEGDYIFANIDGKATLCAYVGDATKIELPQECKSGSYAIAAAAFRGAPYLQSVTIPSSVTNIDNYAFAGCNNLKEIISFSKTPVNSSAYVIYAPNGYIENGYVFADINGTTTLCGYIGNDTRVDLPQECKSGSYAIAAYAFTGNSSIQSITIPNSVTAIGKDAFAGCNGLKEVINFSTIPVESSISSYIVNAPKGNIEGDYIFADIDSTATLCGYIGNATKIELPQQYKNSNYAIATGAFKNKLSIQNITIPNSVTAIGKNAFAGCSGLKEVINFSAVPVENSIAGYVVNAPNGKFEGDYIFADIDSTATLCGYIGNMAKLELPQQYKNCNYAIAAGAFKNNSSIQSITIPNSITAIGSDAFNGCSGLKEVINLSVVQVDKSIATYVINAPKGYIEGATVFADINGVKTQCGYIGESAFNVDGIYYNVLQNDRSTVAVVSNPNKYSGNIVIPESVNYQGATFKVVSIGKFAFTECKSLTGITIPNSVTSIGDRAFYETYALRSIIIPSSVTSIGNNIFESFGVKKIINLSKIAISYHDSTALTHAPNGYIEGAMVYADVNGVKTLFGCIVDGFSVDNIYYSICDEEYSNVAVYKHPDDRKYSGDIVIPESVNYLGSNFKVVAVGGFSGDDITSVKIPNSVTSIYNDAFASCYNLASVTIGNGVKSIGDYAFNSCDELKSIKIPNSVTSIGASAFEDCDGLTKVTMGSGVKTIGEDAFEDCDTITNVYISNLAAWCKIEFSDSLSNPLNAGAKLFVNNAQLTSFVTPKGITKINNFAFFGCKGLTSVNISGSVNTVGERAFKNCTDLKNITLSNKIDELGKEVFFGCEKIGSVTIKRIIKDGFIKGDYNAFSDITYSRATLYVNPAERTLYYYDIDWGWGRFKRVVNKQ